MLLTYSCEDAFGLRYEFPHQGTGGPCLGRHARLPPSHIPHCYLAGVRENCMRNIALKLMYNGTAYHGWQVQRNAVTVCARRCKTPWRRSPALRSI